MRARLAASTTMSENNRRALLTMRAASNLRRRNLRWGDIADYVSRALQTNAANETTDANERSKYMTALFAKLRAGISIFLLASLLVWTAQPETDHRAAVLETIQDHLEMIADHGHSHGFEEDLFWAMHGHSHDVADHDHNPAFLLAARGDGLPPVMDETWRLQPDPGGRSRLFRIERPPRV